MSRLLIVAKEAGAGSLLAALARRWKPDSDSVALVSAVAAPYFADSGLRAEIVSDSFGPAEALKAIRRVKPDEVIVGASAGPSVEKRLIDAARSEGVKVTAYVDHYWNLWQRFADEHSAAPWRYRPDRIFVPAPSCVTRILELGATPGTVAAFEHPLMSATTPARRGSGDALRRRFSVPADAPVATFVSEYLVEQSPVWRWEQPAEADLEGLLRLLLDAAVRTSATVLVKLHPQEVAGGRDWTLVCSDYPAARWRIVPTADKADLFAASKAVFGLNSMLLIEAAAAGVPVYSWHRDATGRGTWLSTIRSEIHELAGLDEAVSVLSA